MINCLKRIIVTMSFLFEIAMCYSVFFLKIHLKLTTCTRRLCSKRVTLFAILVYFEFKNWMLLGYFVKESHERMLLLIFFFQVISKSARKAPETMVSSIGQNVEEDPDTVR